MLKAILLKPLDGQPEGTEREFTKADFEALHRMGAVVLVGEENDRFAAQSFPEETIDQLRRDHADELTAAHERARTLEAELADAREQLNLAGDQAQTAAGELREAQQRNADLTEQLAQANASAVTRDGGSAEQASDGKAAEEPDNKMLQEVANKAAVSSKSKASKVD